MFVLKQLRKEKKINQSDFAEIIGVSLRTIQLYEKRSANIPRKNLEKIARYFEISIADLYTLEGVNEANPNYRLQKAHAEKNHDIIKIGPGSYLISVPLITSKRYEDYVLKHDGYLYLNALPTISFVIEQVSVGHYVSFEIANDSMYDGTVYGIPDKSVVLGKLVPIKKLANIIKNNTDTSWIIVHKSGIMCKSITDYDSKKKLLACSSRNKSPEYSNFMLEIENVKQLFLIIKKQVD